jgi:uncharacterized protein (TIGR02246 family)
MMGSKNENGLRSDGRAMPKRFAVAKSAPAERMSAPRLATPLWGCNMQTALGNQTPGRYTPQPMSRLCLAGCLLTFVALPLAAQSRANDAASLAARLQKFEDKEEIQALLLDYGRHLDNRDFASYGGLFAKDGEWVGGLGTIGGGPASIQAFMEKAIGTGPNRGKNYHLLSNFVIDVKGDTATAWSRWAFVVPGEKGAVISQAGRYDDTLVRENGRWRFQRRVASNDTGAPAPARN